MIKKLFDWTPRDIAYWEQIHQKGLGNFIARYGVIASGGLLFIVFGLIAIFTWLRQLKGTPITPNYIIFLIGQLAFVAIIALVAGVINSLITWVVEERLYKKYKKAERS